MDALDTFVIQSNAIEGYDLNINYITDDALYVDHVWALEYAVGEAKQDRLVHPNVVHGVLMRWILEAQDRGQVRRSMVKVGSHIAPPPLVAEGLLVEWWHAVSRWMTDRQEAVAWQLHLAFEYIHPYVDGNGRTGRVLWAAMQVAAGRAEPIPVYVAERQAYHDELRAFDHGMTDEGLQQFLRAL